MAENKYFFEFSGSTDIGSRKENQDTFCVNNLVPFSLKQQKGGVCNIAVQGADEISNAHLFAVCDGVGACADSCITANLTLMMLIQNIGDICNGTEHEEWICELVEQCDVKLCEYIKEKNICGSNTLTLLVLFEDKFLFANIGDSPAFYIHKNEIEEISVRHNLFTYKKLLGEEPQPRDERVLLYSLGRENMDVSVSQVLNVYIGTLCDGDKFLLCSDGVVNAFSMEMIHDKMVNEYCSARDLTEEAAKIENADNCTAVTISIKALQ